MLAVKCAGMGLSVGEPPEPDPAFVAEFEAAKASFDPFKTSVMRVQAQPRAEGTLPEPAGGSPPPPTTACFVVAVTALSVSAPLARCCVPSLLSLVSPPPRACVVVGFFHDP